MSRDDDPSMSHQYDRMTKAQLIGQLRQIEKIALPHEKGEGIDSALDAMMRELESLRGELHLQNQKLIETRRLLEGSRDRYADLYHFAPLPCTTLCGEGVVREINLTGAILLGYRRDELMNRPFVSHVDEADRQLFETHLARCRRGEGPVRTELRLHTASNQAAPVELYSAAGVKAETGDLHYHTAIIDLTERKRAEAQRERLADVRGNEQLLRTVLATLPVGVLVFDAEKKLVIENDAGRRIGSHAEPPPGGKPIRRPARFRRGGAVLEAEDWPSARAMDRGQTIVNEPIEVDYPDGSRKVLYVSAAPLRDMQGRIIGAVAVEEDMTDLAEAESQLRQAKEAAEAASSLKDDFIATVSHELRSPLSAVLLWVHLLRDDLNEEGDRLEALETIEKSAKAQSQIIDDLLDVSRMMTGKLRLDLRPAAVGPIVAATVHSVLPTADARQVRLELHDDPARPAAIARVDPDRLQQVVWNLLANAVKFTPAGGEIDVWIRTPADRIQISVADTGIGIRPDFLPYIFDRFRQAQPSTTRSHGGLGLGLAISRQLVQMHGGQLLVSSEGEGKGSIFTIELPSVSDRALPPRRSDESPVRDAPSPERVLPVAAAAPPRPMRQAVNPLNGLHVLLVEDEADARTALSHLLNKAGARVTAVDSAPAAREALNHVRPDVLVSDIAMPGEDGYSLIDRIRRIEARASGKEAQPAAAAPHPLPAIALTAYARDQDRDKAINAGFQAHLCKPVEPDELVRTIRRLADDQSTAAGCS